MEGGEDIDELEEVRRIRRLAMLQRENRRLRHSVSFRAGLHLTNAIRQPWKLPLLPLSFPLLCFKIGLERIGKAASPKSNQSDREIHERNNSIVLFPTNGVGFGHFTRMYAVARELRRKHPDMEIIFFTTMPTLHIPYVENFATYHLAGRNKYKDMSSSTWNMLVEEMLTLVLETHHPRYFMFDGAYPYRGMLNSIYARDEIQRIWMRRGMFRKGASIPVDSIEHFDLIVHPGDAIPAPDSEIEHGVSVLSTPPVTIFNPEEILSKKHARRRLNLPLDAIVTYVQLGAGQINDIDSEVSLTVDALLEHENMHVVVGESMLGERLPVLQERVHLLRDYPNALFFNAFDYSVQAGGYNSFHEMRLAGIPTLFFPNMNTGMDNQKMRCEIAVSEGWGLITMERNAQTISKDIKKLLQFAKNVSSTNEMRENGASTLVNYIV